MWKNIILKDSDSVSIATTEYTVARQKKLVHAELNVMLSVQIRLIIHSLTELIITVLHWTATVKFLLKSTCDEN